MIRFVGHNRNRIVDWYPNAWSLTIVALTSKLSSGRATESGAAATNYARPSAPTIVGLRAGTANAPAFARILDVPAHLVKVSSDAWAGKPTTEAPRNRILATAERSWTARPP